MLFSEWVNKQPGTRAEVARRIGISRVGLYKIMRGQVFPRGTTRAAINRETGGNVTTDALAAAFNTYHAPKET
jgi:DNA-binding phage protein